MGFRLSWIAIKGTPPDIALDSLSLERTGTRESTPESQIACASLPNGWFLIVVNDHIPSITGPDSAAAISVGCRAVVCHVNETTMDSSAAGYEDGGQTWSVIHNPEQDPTNVDICGRPPESLNNILERLNAAQNATAGDDTKTAPLFEAPVDLANDIVGFRYDADVESEDDPPFEVLRLKRRPRKWRFW
ncbi:MAG TPA: hypothetical protein PK093_15905 [Phycisphaerae bacterium]|nr:hypothetical protein [Phycisphaerae bacterium]